MEQQRLIASVPADRLWILSQHWISLPRAGSSRLTGRFWERVDVLLPLDKGEYNSRLSLQGWAPTNICRKASKPHQQCSSPSPQVSYLCSPLKDGGTHPQQAQLPTWYRKTAFSHCENEQIFNVWVAQRTSALNWITAQASSRDSTKKQNMDWCWLLSWFSSPLVKERPINQASETYWGRKCWGKKKKKDTDNEHKTTFHLWRLIRSNNKSQLDF